MPSVLITGASRGIGEASARRFAAAGFDLQLVARSGGALKALASELRSEGRHIETAVIDLADPAAIEPGLRELHSRAGTPTVLINNAGMAWTGPLAEMPLERWQELLQLNLTSVFQVCRALLPELRRQPGALIINVSSHASRNAFPDWGAYCASKAALASFSRCLAEEERAHGIRVCTLTLGSVNTPLWDTETVNSSFDRHAMLSAGQAAEALLYLAQQPSTQVADDLTLMPALGAF
ncbi:MAG: SDR family oxidoreductase [Synechococcaceae cyanobacterium]|nr:SDR family oxidoreductase [Synechococcaceae cyanobacterium]